MLTCQKTGGNGGTLASFAQQELFVGVIYPAGKGLNQSFYFPCCFHCLNIGNSKGIWGRVSNFPTERTKYEKLSP